MLSFVGYSGSAGLSLFFNNGNSTSILGDIFLKKDRKIILNKDKEQLRCQNTKIAKNQQWQGFSMFFRTKILVIIRKRLNLRRFILI